MNGNYYGNGGPWWGNYPPAMNPYISPCISPWAGPTGVSGAAPGGGGMGYQPYFTPTGVLDDSEMASYVRDNIDLDPYISVRDKNSIDVDVSGGVVTLSGIVQNRRSKGLAYADAFWVPGILDVTDNLEVREEAKPTVKEKSK